MNSLKAASGPDMNMDRQAALARVVAWGLVAASAIALTLALWAGVKGTTVLSAFDVFMLALVGLGVVGTLIVRRARNQVGWIFVVFGFGAALAILAGAIESLNKVVHVPGAEWFLWWNDVGFLLVIYALAPLFLLFPDGHLPSLRWRWVARVYATGVGLSLVWDLTAHARPNGASGIVYNNPTYVHWPEWFTSFLLNVGGALAIGAGLASVVALVVRYRRARGEARLQMKWLVAVVVVGASLLVTGLLTTLVAGIFSLKIELPDLVFWLPLSLLVGLGIPVAVTIGVFRYKLYEIDIVISKTIVFAGLALFITVVYATIVAGVGALVGATNDRRILSIIAAFLVAIAFQPVRERLRRFANRVVYGERATPYEVLARFSDRVGSAYAAEDILPRTARVIADGVGASRAEVWLHVGDALALTASWPSIGGDGPASISMDADAMPEMDADRAVAVRYQGELLGAITVTKPRNEPLTQQEINLIDRLAEQSALVLANVRLTADLESRLATIRQQAAQLRASRQRIVAAQDEERRRLERNIHDGAQQHLVALAVKLRLAKATLVKDPERAGAMLADLRSQVDDALDTLRVLALGVYPPLLEEQGIAAALAAQHARSNLPVHVEADGVGRYPIEIEAAVYFCVLEALQNASKYSEAGRIDVAIVERSGAITFEIHDDGRGFDARSTGSGTGLHGMQDRVAVFGGEASIESTPGHGTTVRGRVPVPQLEAVR
jgi:signal transduction histidine kinase